MTSACISKPVAPAIGLDDIKRYLRIDSDHEDNTLQDLIRAATEFVERDCGLALISQVWRFYFDEIPEGCAVELNRRPIIDMVELNRFDSAGNRHTVGAENWFLNRLTEPARVRLLNGISAFDMSNGFELDIEIGFGSTSADVPDTIKQALRALISHWYEFRHAFDASDQPVSVPPVYHQLTAHLRRARL